MPFVPLKSNPGSKASLCARPPRLIFARCCAPGPEPFTKREVESKWKLPRRELLLSSTAVILGPLSIPVAKASVSTSCEELFKDVLEKRPDYSQQGPLSIVHLPRLETLCTQCFSRCAGSNCLIRVNITYPKGGASLGLGPPYPLAILTAGFLVGSESYLSYAERLASWGYTVILYDKVETPADFLDDVNSVKVILQLMDWAEKDALVRRIADVSRVYLIGHSRGGKLSTLAAVQDPRVAAVCLLDPVDLTVYAPLAPGFPSALTALRGEEFERSKGPAAYLDPENQGLSPAAEELWSRPSERKRESGQGEIKQEEIKSAESPKSGSLRDYSGADSSWPRPPPPGVSTFIFASPPATQVQSVPIFIDNARVPIAVVGSGQGGDCAPSVSNFSQFFQAAPGPSWQVSLGEAGHFDYLDHASPLQRAVCPAATGGTEEDVRSISQTVMVAWGEAMIRHKGRDILREAPGSAYPQACSQQPRSQQQRMTSPLFPHPDNQTYMDLPFAGGQKKAANGASKPQLASTKTEKERGLMSLLGLGAASKQQGQQGGSAQMDETGDSSPEVCVQSIEIQGSKWGFGTSLVTSAPQPEGTLPQSLERVLDRVVSGRADVVNAFRNFSDGSETSVNVVISE